MSKHSIPEVSDEGIVNALIEKPKPEETDSRKAIRYVILYSG